jgi:ferredoxin
MGTLSVPEEFDLHLTDLGDSYFIQVGSEKGAALVEGYPQAREANGADHRRLSQVVGEKWPRFPYRLEVDASELSSLMAISYRSVLWEELGRQCLGCGACTLVCPTCVCFNTADETGLDPTCGERQRVWDSCQFNDFALVAGGHDFRPGRAARQRHRFFRKYNYQAAASGLSGCVGCGRCAAACLVHIRPVETLNRLHDLRAAMAGRRQEASS